MARLVPPFLEALGLTDVTLAGDDTGGALCQFAIDTDPGRIGRLVLTTGGDFDQFPPRGIHPADLLDVSTRLGRFSRPVLLLWDTGDRVFKPPLARRRAAAFPDARPVEVGGGHTFLRSTSRTASPARSAPSWSPPGAQRPIGAPPARRSSRQAG